ncbi:CZB domain-containing protein, partial [Macromonas bipunctata]|uniref:CZB domain-containing protein n=1 Tax=Macromonas bipunctata TaxID=183670 RepID=UPI00147669ED
IRVFRLADNDTTLAETDAVELRRSAASSVEKTGSDPAELDFGQARAVHQQWRITLRNAIQRRLKVDVDTLRRDDCCKLGQWLHGPAKGRWGTVPAFSALVQQHRAFHQEAGKVGDLINQQHFEQAQRTLEPGASFHQAGQQTMLLLHELQQHVQGGGPASAPKAAAAAPVAPRSAARTPAPAARAGAQPVRVEPSAQGDWTTF